MVPPDRSGIMRMPLEIIAWRGAALFVSADTGLRLLSLMAIRSGRAGEASELAWPRGISGICRVTAWPSVSRGK